MGPQFDGPIIGCRIPVVNAGAGNVVGGPGARNSGGGIEGHRHKVPGVYGQGITGIDDIVGRAGIVSRGDFVSRSAGAQKA